MNQNTKRAIAKYGESVCREAFRLYASGEYGDGNITAMLNLKNRNQGNAAINAGRDLFANHDDYKIIEVGQHFRVISPNGDESALYSFEQCEEIAKLGREDKLLGSFDLYPRK
jgi:hypothetical protein